MMSIREGLVLVGLMVLVLALFPEACIAKKEHRQCPSSCGSTHNIRYPFRFKDDPSHCGHSKYELACENNRTTLHLYAGKYYVQEIDYGNKTIRVVDASLHKNSCSLPRFSLTRANFSCSDPYYLNSFAFSSTGIDDDAIVFMNCTQPVNSSLSVDVTSCLNNSLPPKMRLYALHGTHWGSVEHEQCRIQVEVPARFLNFTTLSIFDIQDELLQGFQLSRGRTGYDLLTIDGYHKMFGYNDYLTVAGRVASIIIKCFVLGRTSLGILFLIALLIHKFRQRHLSFDDKIEEFLQSHNNFMPIRYSYSQIKEMTKGFKDKLGQGGFGSVYKGKAKSGHLIAVKVLSMSKANGQDFISEVATIGRIHHVNIVRLIGFCVEGSKQALIYDFMANGSLDKLIFCEGEKINPLRWERIYEIALGVARGIEYLHRGCDMQILYFDIKPHNILLDENFIPKISDFGLAKLYPIDNSIVSLTAARGTLGYTAPELFYNNIGGISYKADVYSFGEDIELVDINEDEQKFARKMIIVALWCIQLKPTDRPSMSEALEMLESEVELLQMPPKPFLCPQEISIVNHEDINPRGKPISSHTDMGTITLDGR
ncbi:hypothetical protein L1049_019273 [Liquidambar formosana]|uniref:non-specific serine/threonine protein kinase n=1 Tax=Liquidambar formosana TaxID=63359 RepID=A0AAP0S7Y3_LIQFO